MEPLPFDALTLRKKIVNDKLPRIIVGEKFSITMYTKLPLFIVGSPNMVDREVQSFYFVFYDNLEKVRAPIWISIKFVFATAANFMRAVENFSQNLTSSPLARSNQTLQANLSGFITWDFMLIHVPVWKSIDWCIIIAQNHELHVFERLFWNTESHERVYKRGNLFVKGLRPLKVCITFDIWCNVCLLLNFCPQVSSQSKPPF